ncbi:hypothetical protein HAX54_032766 [Datura stramonium]|uniref:Uncharacterized protein n=1 Tax=Datura stramonium TaxID=4076 RepID=A0ABS8VCL8_DATST|nr:hypothetical protein [Datura stramonium]
MPPSRATIEALLAEPIPQGEGSSIAVPAISFASPSRTLTTSRTEMLRLIADLYETRAAAIELRARGPSVESIEINLLAVDATRNLLSLLESILRVALTIASPTRATSARAPSLINHHPEVPLLS